MSEGRKAMRVVHGDDLLYRFLNEMLNEDDERFRAVPRLLIQAMAIWFPLDVYERTPVLAPWVVRDPKSRGSKSQGLPDAWGSPDDAGYFRDDNSLVKSIPRSLSIHSPHAARGLRGARMGTEFVASHIWRVVDWDGLASRHPLLNTFVPNLVWLPSQISKLSDREGGPVQSTLQSMAWAIYRDARIAPHLRDPVEEAWALLPRPNPVDVDLDDLNVFVSTERFIETRLSRIRLLIDALRSLEAGRALEVKVISSRYTEGLPSVSSGNRLKLIRHMERFVPSAPQHASLR